VRVERIVPNPKLKLMEQVREVMRDKHYSIRTERCYCDWIRRYVKFHGMQCRADLEGGKAKIERFLSDLAVRGKVAASTQNQAFNVLLFLYRVVLDQDLGRIQALRADRPERVPTVLTAEEVRRVIPAMQGTPQLVVKLLYGSGLPLSGSAATAFATASPPTPCSAGRTPGLFRSCSGLTSSQPR